MRLSSGAALWRRYAGRPPAGSVPRGPDAFVAAFPALAAAAVPDVGTKVPVRARIVVRPGAVIVLADIRARGYDEPVTGPGRIVI